MTGRHTRKDTIENEASIYCLVCKGLSIDDVEVSRDTVVQEIRPGAGFETGDFVKETLGGLRLHRGTTHLRFVRVLRVPTFFLSFFFSHFYFPASGQAVVTGVIPSSRRFLPSIFIAHRVQRSH